MRVYGRQWDTQHTQLTLALLTILAWAADGLRTVQLSVGDAQLFAQAVADFGTTGEDTVLELPPGEVFSLANATIVNAQARPGRQPFSSGTLAIRPAGGNTTGTTVLDGGMQYGMASYKGQPALFTGTARLLLQNLTLVNICDAPVVLVPGVQVDSAINLGLFPRTSAYQSHVYNNVVIYVRQADLAGWMYAFVVLQTPFSQLSAPLAPFLNNVPKLDMTALMMTPFSTNGLSFSLPEAVGGWISYRSVVDPTDPLLVGLRARGLLLPARYCGASGTPPTMINPATPLWMVGDTKQFVEAVTQALNPPPAPGIFSLLRLPPVVMLMGRAVPLGYIPPPSFTLTSTLLLSSMRGGVYGVSSQGTIDTSRFNGPFITVDRGGLLFMELLRLRGLATRPVPGTNTSSVFPLAAFPTSAANSSQPYIFINNATIELPDTDYLALLTLAQPNLTACIGSPAVQAHAAALNTQIAQVTLQQLAPGYSSMLLLAFVGYGISASYTNLAPANLDLPATIAVACLSPMRHIPASTTAPAASPALPSTATGLSTTDIIILACSVVAALLLVVAIIWGVVLLRRMSRPVSKPSSTPAGAPPAQMDPAAPSNPAALSKATDSPTRIAAVPGRRSRNDWRRLRWSLRWSASSYTSSRASGMASTTDHGSGPSSFTPHQQDSAASFQGPAAAQHASAALPEATPAMQAQAQSTAALSQAAAMVTLDAPQQQYISLAEKDVQQLEQFCGRTAAVQRVHAQEKRRDGNPEFGPALVVLLPSLTTANHSMGQTARRASASSAKRQLAQHSWQGKDGSEPQTQRFSAQDSQLGRLEHSVQPCSCDGHKAHSDQILPSRSRRPRAGSAPTRFANPRDAIRSMVDKYQEDTNTVKVMGLLGQGSWGSVYCGEWRGLKVAVKTMLFEVPEEALAPSSYVGSSSSDAARAASNPVQSQQYAINEAAVAASVDHRNVVRTYYYDVKSVQTTQHGTSSMTGLQIHGEEVQTGACRIYKLFLVQELCTTTLALLLGNHLLHDGRTGAVYKLAVTLILLDIAQGLEYLHSRNIVHGDLKPANVLLVPEPTSAAGFVAKLADFGLSARLAVGATHVSNYRSGTPFYVAPEVAQEHRTSTAADIFSFGVLMWQIYTGQSPFLISGTMEYSWNTAFPFFLAPNIPDEEYASVVYRCLSINPKERPTASELAVALQHWCVQLSVSEANGAVTAAGPLTAPPQPSLPLPSLPPPMAPPQQP